MDARALEELELLQVTKLYALDQGSAVIPVKPAPATVSPATTATWDELRIQVAECRACGLCAQRKQAVFGVGNETAPWLFVGEGPGADEDEHGEPFVGQAGKLLDSMLAAVGCQRGRDVYIANVVKCRPPGNRTPTPDEAAACAPFLDRQIELVGPKLIVALGKTAATRLLGTEATLASLRGRVHRYRGIPLVVTYHPAYLLRSLPEKAKAWEDLVFARRTLAAAT
jgi:uracil-DNA glycosylase family 4